MKKETKAILFRLPSDIHQEYRKIAKKERRSLSGLLRIILEDHLINIRRHEERKIHETARS